MHDSEQCLLNLRFGAGKTKQADPIKTFTELMQTKLTSLTMIILNLFLIKRNCSMFNDNWMSTR